MQVVYFTQDDFKDGEVSQHMVSDKDKREGTDLDAATEARFKAAMKGRKLLLNQYDGQSMISKTSIQMLNYLGILHKSKSQPLMQDESLIRPIMFDTPLNDTQMLKRIILYSDSE